MPNLNFGGEPGVNVSSTITLKMGLTIPFKKLPSAERTRPAVELNGQAKLRAAMKRKQCSSGQKRRFPNSPQRSKKRQTSSNASSSEELHASLRDASFAKGCQTRDRQSRSVLKSCDQRSRSASLTSPCLVQNELHKTSTCSA